MMIMLATSILLEFILGLKKLSVCGAMELESMSNSPSYYVLSQEAAQAPEAHFDYAKDFPVWSSNIDWIFRKGGACNYLLSAAAKVLSERWIGTTGLHPTIWREV